MARGHAGRVLPMPRRSVRGSHDFNRQQRRHPDRLRRRHSNCHRSFQLDTEGHRRCYCLGDLQLDLVFSFGYIFGECYFGNGRGIPPIAFCFLCPRRHHGRCIVLWLRRVVSSSNNKAFRLRRSSLGSQKAWFWRRKPKADHFEMKRLTSGRASMMRLILRTSTLYRKPKQQRAIDVSA